MTHGGKICPLALLAAEGKPVILEIDPPVDDLSHRRQGFYERAGYHANPYAHVHPPYHAANRGHALVVMSYPGALTQIPTPPLPTTCSTRSWPVSRTIETEKRRGGLRGVFCYPLSCCAYSSCGRRRPTAENDTRSKSSVSRARPRMSSRVTAS